MKTSNTSAMFSVFETSLMQDLIQQASAYSGFTHPNPLVGAAVYKDETIISIGVHQKKGEKHAEVLALEKAGSSANGASLMVTLEPCVHHGSTPPCVDAIVKAGIRDVVVGVLDPCKPGKAVSARDILESKGIRVRNGLCVEEATQLNHDYMFAYTTKRPYVRLKAAMTLDGKIALPSGDSTYITSEASRKHVHAMRAASCGIVVGKQTLLQDNPKLTVRYDQLLPHQVPPILFVVANELDMTRKFAIFESGYRCVLVTTSKPLAQKKGYFSECWYVAANKQNQLDWAAFLTKCVEAHVYSVMLEGGAQLYSSALEGGHVNECSFFIAPCFMGDDNAPSVLQFSRPATSLSTLLRLQNVTVKQFGDDTCISGRCST